MSTVFESFTSTQTFTKGLSEHLQKVYLTLGVGCIVGWLGVEAFMASHISPGLALPVSLLCIVLLIFTDKSKMYFRFAIYSTLCFSQGYGVGALVEIANIVDPVIVTTALVTTSVVFISFSIVAIKSERRSHLYLGGLLSSSLTFLLLAELVNLFLDSVMLFNIQVYFGLLVFSGYVIFDTQLIVEKYFAGDQDHILHALELFLDMVGIFVRVLIILLQERGNRSESRSKQNSSRATR